MVNVDDIFRRIGVRAMYTAVHRAARRFPVQGNVNANGRAPEKLQVLTTSGKSGNSCFHFLITYAKYFPFYF